MYKIYLYCCLIAIFVLLLDLYTSKHDRIAQCFTLQDVFNTLAIFKFSLIRVLVKNENIYFSTSYSPP